MRFGRKQIEEHAAEHGLTFHACNDTHWQIRGGIAVVNLHLGKDGITLYVQGMAKGRRLKVLADISTAAKQVTRSNGKANRKQSYREVKRRKWRAAKRNGQPCCHWCKAAFASFEDTTADHVVPLSKGGSNGDDNIVLSCDSCNQSRGNNVTAQDLKTVNKGRSNAAS